MGQPVQLPDPTYKAAKYEADERDISMGAVVESWRREARGEMQSDTEDEYYGKSFIETFSSGESDER